MARTDPTKAQWVASATALRLDLARRTDELRMMTAERDQARLERDEYRRCTNSLRYQLTRARMPWWARLGEWLRTRRVTA